MAAYREDSTDAALIRLLRQLTTESDRFAEMFGEAHGMHRTDLNALTVIMDADRRGEAISPGELAAALHMSASATTAVLDRLENSGHITRGRSPHDRRKIALRMPDKAIELGRRFFQPLGEEYSRNWEAFDDSERAAIARFLRASIDATIEVRGQLDES